MLSPSSAVHAGAVAVMNSSSSSSQTAAATGYFIDGKKGEVNELKALLKDINVERDMKRKREVIKKVIAYMTLGIDVSRLFTDMVMAIETKDIVIKKMVYLYLCNYCHKEPDMAVLCINTLRRDCDDDDPMVRGLALRSLCSLRLPSMLEYVQQPVRKGLSDISAYVRKTAVMGVLKLHNLNPGVAEQNGYMITLTELLMDVDVNVVTNVVHVFNELKLAQGGLEVTPTIVAHLLNRIADFSEWGLCAVLELVSRYEVQSEEEMYAVMNLLDPVLRSANSGAVLGTIKCFLRLTAKHEDLLPQILARSKAPLMTLVTGTQPEIQYATLKHLLVLCSGQGAQTAARGAFDDEFRHFFVRYNEPAHVKYLKVEILPCLTNDRNARAVISELIEYVTDVDAELARRSIAAMGTIARRVASVAEETAQQLVDLMDLDMSYVRGEALKALASLLRVFPAAKAQVIPFLGKFWRRVCHYGDDAYEANSSSSATSSSLFSHYSDGAAGDTTEARAVVLWMIGEYGEDVPEAPYLLETAVRAYHEEHSSAALKLQLLTATMKLFFKRPPEVHPYLGTILALAIEDTGSQDVHDRALLYYRLLSATDVNAAQRIFRKDNDTAAQEEEKSLCGSLYSLGFAEERDSDRTSRVLKEFNSLAVIYGMPSVLFIEDAYRLKLENAPLLETFSMLPPSLLATAASSNGAGSASTSAAPSMNNAVAAVAIGDGVNLLDWGDSDTESPRKSTVDPSHSLLNETGPSSSSSSSLVLKELVELSPTRFQELWTSLPDAFSGALPLSAVGGGAAASSQPSSSSSSSQQHQKLSLSSVEAAVRTCHVQVMASGPTTVADEQGLGPTTNGSSGMKFFLYGQETDDFMGTEGNILLAQLIIVPSAVVVSRNGVSGNSHDSSSSGTPLVYSVTVTVKATTSAGMGLLDVPAVPNLGIAFAALLQTVLTPLGIVS